MPLAILVVEQSNTPTDLEKVCAENGAGYLRLVDPGGPFRKSYLINVAARYLAGQASHFVTLDVDAILLENSFSRLIDLLQENPDKALSIRPRRLPRMSYLDRSMADLVRRAQDWGDTQSWGMCLVHSFAEFERLRGFDEDFAGWGSEDTNYALRSGAEMVDLGVALLHQWHPAAPQDRARLNQSKVSLPNSNGSSTPPRRQSRGRGESTPSADTQNPCLSEGRYER
jgi:hypothetical protein